MRFSDTILSRIATDLTTAMAELARKDPDRRSDVSSYDILVKLHDDLFDRGLERQGLLVFSLAYSLDAVIEIQYCFEERSFELKVTWQTTDDEHDDTFEGYYCSALDVPRDLLNHPRTRQALSDAYARLKAQPK